MSADPGQVAASARPQGAPQPAANGQPAHGGPPDPRPQGGDGQGGPNGPGQSQSPQGRGQAGSVVLGQPQGDPRQAPPRSPTVAELAAKAAAGLASKLGPDTGSDEQFELHRAFDEFAPCTTIAGDAIGGDSVAGDSVGGSKNTYNTYLGYQGQGAAPPRSYTVRAAVIDQPFVAGPGQQALCAAVRDRRIVVVRGEPGGGRFAALLNAYREIGDGELVIRKLPTATDLTTLSIDDYPENAVLILTDVSGRAAAALDDDDTAERLVEDLHGHGCRLGLTVDSAAMLIGSDCVAVVDAAGRPDPRAVFEHHLAWQLAADRAARDALLTDPAVRLLLEGELTDTIPLGVAASWAAKLASYKDAPGKAAAAARWDMLNERRRNCVRWFQTLPNRRAQCMAIALAVLNGLAHERVEQAANLLEQIIDAGNDLQIVQKTATNPFATSADVEPSELRARRVRGTTLVDALPMMTLAYNDAGYPRWVLQAEWARGSALKWLEPWLLQLGRHDNAAVRIRAAMAAGMLAVDSFDVMRARIILNWAYDEDPRGQYSAAIALTLPAVSREIGPTVLEQIEDWTRQSNFPLLQATAARVFGTHVGLARPSAALRKLEALAAVNHEDVALAVARALGDLIRQGTPALAGRVLADIARWVAGTDKIVRRTGRFAFYYLTHLNGAPHEIASATNDRQRPTPTLLTLIQHSPKLAAPVAALWSDGVCSADFHQLVQPQLDAWAEKAESDPIARMVLVDLLRRSAHDPRTNQILVRMATRWAGTGGVAPTTSRTLLTH